MIKRLKIWFWWNFQIKRDEFHYSLDIFTYPNKNQLIARRQIAHFLDMGYSIWELPEVYVELF